MKMMSGLSKYQPKTMKHFKSSMGSVLKEGVLDTKTKELIDIGTSIAAKCKYCIAIHVEKALSDRATKEEIFEAATLVILMDGGPTMTYVCEVKNAFDNYMS